MTTCRVNTKFVKIRLIQLDMTQHDLSDRSGLSEQGVIKVLRTGNATVETLGKLAAGLNCHPADLLLAEGYPTPLVGAQAVYA